MKENDQNRIQVFNPFLPQMVIGNGNGNGDGDDEVMNKIMLTAIDEQQE